MKKTIKLDTKSLVRRAFCPNHLLDLRQNSGKNWLKKAHFAYILWRDVRNDKDVLYLAQAARRFVKMEEKEKNVRKIKK